jgi:hypothetical protein
MINIILILIIIIIIFLILNKKKTNKKIPKHKHKKNINTYSINNYDNNIESDIVQFRGVHNVQIKKPFDEKGGSKIFKADTLDNDNLKNNKINFYNYESYRNKPYTLDSM